MSHSSGANDIQGSSAGVKKILGEIKDKIEDGAHNVWAMISGKHLSSS